MKKSFKVIKYLSLLMILTFLVTGCFGKVKEEDKARNDKNISLGEWNENIYTNDFLDVKYTKPDNWSKYSDEEIAKMMNLSIENLKDKNGLSSKLVELTSVIYMMTSDPNTGSNVILMSEKPLMKDVTMDYYTNSLKTQLESNTSAGYTVKEIKEETVNNFKYTTILCETSPNGSIAYQKYYIRKFDNYFISIIATTTGVDNLAEMVNSFEKLN